MQTILMLSLLTMLCCIVSFAACALLMRWVEALERHGVECLIH